MPKLDAEALVAAVPELADIPGLRARTVNTRPSVQLTGVEALDIARAAAAEADAGPRRRRHFGTDTLEEVALLCDLLYAGEAPIVFTGAMRPASALGRGRARPTCSTPSSWRAPPAPTGLGVLIAFAGKVHAARAVRKVDSTAPDAFDSPRLGPVGRVQEGRAWMARRLERFPPVPVAALDATVHIVPAALGADGTLVDAALEAGADGLVGRRARRRPHAAAVPRRHAPRRRRTCRSSSRSGPSAARSCAARTRSRAPSATCAPGP